MKTIDFEVSYYHRVKPSADAFKHTRKGVIKTSENDTHVSLREKISSQLCDLILKEDPSANEVEICEVTFSL